MFTSTLSKTYTVTDIRDVLASFAADFSMMAEATGLRSRESVTETVGDIIGFAAAGYLQAIDIILLAADDTKLRAAKYTISITAAGWANDRPGNNLWPRTPSGTLQVVVTLSPAWSRLSDLEQRRVREQQGITGDWPPTNVDTSHRELVAAADRRYASNGFGAEKTSYQ